MTIMPGFSSRLALPLLFALLRHQYVRKPGPLSWSPRNALLCLLEPQRDVCCLELYKPSRFYCWLGTRWPDIGVSCSANVGVQLKKSAKLPLCLSPVLAIWPVAVEFRSFWSLLYI